MSKTRRPANSAFKQQRLKAWQPILTPKAVLPAFIVIGILFAPLGGLLLWASDTVAEVIVDYTACDKAGPNYVHVPQTQFTTNFPGSAGNGDTPEYKSVQGVGSANNVTWPTTRCTVKFNLPATMTQPVFVYYRLTDFYQNHRRYVKSLDESQLSGVYRSAADLEGGACDPMATLTENGIQYPIYPCGLVANSMFNDSFSLTMLPFDNTTNNNAPYILSDTNIAWKSDADKYGPQPYTNLSMVRPPPNWRNFPNGYSAASPPIDITKDEHFQIWMRTSGLPNFRKMYSKNDVANLPSGTYTIDIDMNYNVSSYGGTKSIVISTVSFMGSRNPFLGIAYIVVGALCVVLGLLFMARHMYRPRRLGDHTCLSGKQDAARSDLASATATGARRRNE